MCNIQSTSLQSRLASLILVLRDAIVNKVTTKLFDDRPRKPRLRSPENIRCAVTPSKQKYYINFDFSYKKVIFLMKLQNFTLLIEK